MSGLGQVPSKESSRDVTKDLSGEAPIDPFKPTSEYYRKLNQQLVQKDNIIKLLQLKLKNLESDPLAPTAVKAEADAVESTRVRVLEAQLVDRDRDTTALRIKNEDLQRALADATTEVTDLRRAALDAADRAELAAQVGQLEGALGRVQSEAKARNLRVLELESELQRATASRSAPTADPVLASQLEVRDHELATSRDEISRLERLLAEQAQVVAPSPFPVATDGVPGRVDLAALHAVIGARTRTGELIRTLTTRGEAAVQESLAAAWQLEAHLGVVGAGLGIQPIATVGEKFDPRVHQVVEMVYGSTHEHESVIGEVSPGFVATGSDGGRVIRLADVVVGLNPYWCGACEKVAPASGRFCPDCGGRLLGQEKEGIRVLDERAAALSAIERAQAHEVAGELDRARVCLEKALVVDPAHPRALEILVRIHERDGRYSQARDLLERLAAVSLDPGDVARTRARLDAKLSIVEKLRSLT